MGICPVQGRNSLHYSACWHTIWLLPAQISQQLPRFFQPFKHLFGSFLTNPASWESVRWKVGISSMYSACALCAYIIFLVPAQVSQQFPRFFRPFKHLSGSFLKNPELWDSILCKVGISFMYTVCAYIISLVPAQVSKQFPRFFRHL